MSQRTPQPAVAFLLTSLRFWPEAAALLSGSLLALCYAPWNLGWLVWVWSFPLLGALWFSSPRHPGRPRWRLGFRLGYLCGLSFFLINVSWITEISSVAGTRLAGLGALVALAGYLALYFALFGAFAATVGRWSPAATDVVEGRKAYLAPSLAALRVAILNGAAWCGLEWLRGLAFTGFGWNGLGVALKDQLVLVQFADVIGITGYGFLLMAVANAFFCALVRLIRDRRLKLKPRPHFEFTAAAALVAGLFLYGLSAFLRPPGESVDLRARVFQFNVALEEKWSDDLAVRRKVVEGYRDLTRTFVETAPHDLVLWPETAVPGVFSARWVQEYLNEQILRNGDFYFLSGLEDVNLEHSEIYNTLMIMRGDTSSYQMHIKTHLVPFGEYIPLRGRFPLFEWIAGGIIAQDFTAGTSYEPLRIEKGEQAIGIVPLICFEDTVPRLTRRFLRPGPQVLVNVTNDGWFRESAQAQQHFDNALFRCIEYRRPMIRAANTGVSGFIDERGSLYDRSGRDAGPRILRDPVNGSTYIRGTLPALLAVPLDPPTTIYARIGDSVPITLGLLALIAALRAGWRRRH